MSRFKKSKDKINLTEDSIRFLVATDIHLGHKQDHPIRKNDSFNAFEQVLSIANYQNADFLLLGGDLFDHVNPSQTTIYKCLDILQHYVQGESPTNLSAHFALNKDYKINFENENLGIKMPVFTIHGNHDYPNNEFGKVSICDLLHVSNYANYFGKHRDLRQIVIDPLIIKKKGVVMKVAIYGLGYIKDPVLRKIFEEKKVIFKEPEDKQNTFCLFILHQNRYKKSFKAGAPQIKCISSRFIPEWIDLTIWGHEHQAINKVQIEDDRQIFQPGSTVITSFIQAQSFMKQSVLIEIKDNGEVQVNSKPLKKSFRPMVHRHYELANLYKNIENFDCYKYMDVELAQIIKETKQEFPDRKPIIRLKIQHTGHEIQTIKTLQAKYAQQVANCQSIIQFWRRALPTVKRQKVQNEQIDGQSEGVRMFRTKQFNPDVQIDISEMVWIQFLKSLKYCPYGPNKMEQFKSQIMMREENQTTQYGYNFFNKDDQKILKAQIAQVQTWFQDFSIQSKEIGDQMIEAIYEECPQLRPKIDQPKQENKKSLDTQLNQNAGNNNKTKKKFPGKFLQNQNIQMLKLKEQQLSQEKSMYKFNNQEEIRLALEQISRKKQLNKPAKVDLNKDYGSYDIQDGDNMLQEYQEQQRKKRQKQDKQCNQNQQIKGNPSNKQPRSGILKKSEDIKSTNHIHNHDNQQNQQDCCKRAEKTQYNEQQTKQNFSQANKNVKNKAIPKGKKNAKTNKSKQATNSMDKKKKTSSKEKNNKNKNKKSVQFKEQTQ